ncbi:NAD(P)H-quinone oxidoreductase [Mycolicibacterium rhodesiae]|uniref:NADPH:quinone oxidoreductase n=1 Tax=Mycolicibacterium rhodesiae TaxID=36814 RepID=A0A1X0ITQ7_MYCRH|nr:NAD(P)H-quinone oxidoreductase [Mycolicibacterium rhodesiae]MCV7343670.1 NAD(P)H-quinone oxidoreductase [Mycolicibacterium rhodesiae]ORB51380.1 NADPH:quinone oxidoreductase [Mycolicibacterium rhodesiae]
MPSAVLFDHPGDPDVLQWRPVEPLNPGADQVVIGVAAAGINNADLLQRRGRYPVPAGAPRPLGLECAGTILAVGSAVTAWSPGEQVCALLDGGGYADQVAVPATQVMPIPRGLSLVEAAAVPEVACTVYSNLAMVAGLTGGHNVLIHGAGGGIGSFAIQWARAIGAHVLTTAGSDAKAQAGRDLGAQVVINYRSEDFVAATLAATGGQGVDAILDVVGADYLARNLQSLASDGHLVIIGGCTEPTLLDIGVLMAKRASVTATMLRARPADQKAAIVAGVIRDVFPLFETGAIRAVVDTVVPLSDAAQAHRLLESGKTVGKVILDNQVRAGRRG